ncbi:MAG: protein kinase domain-containing protein [Thermoanaerobaculia bacterium]
MLHYRLVRRLGSGGSGDVFEAEDTRLERWVAIKLLHADRTHDPDGVERLRREARALASLEHPGVVGVHAIEEVDDRIFLVMERVHGSTLASEIPEGGFAPDRLMELALGLAGALAAAHAGGVVHRDLKPGNVMITTDGCPKVLDFGLARLVGAVDGDLATHTARELTVTGAAVGTWHYMAPEQIAGEPADARSDVFSLGVVLYELATGLRPFTGASVVEVADAVRNREPPPLREVRPDLPAAFTDVVHWCLRKDRDARPASARMVHDALVGRDRRDDGAGRRAGTQRAQQPPETPARPPPRPRLPRRRALLALSAFVLLAVAATALFLLRRPSPPASAVAVLPFANLTGDSELDHLSRGIPAGLITRLAQVSGLQVLSRSEAWQTADRSAPPEVLARRLATGSLVEGELHAVGEKLRVEVKLTDGPSGLVLWSEAVEGSEAGLFELQREIAADLVRVLAVPLSDEERARLARDPTSSLVAYAGYLRGEHHLAQATDRQSVELAADHFRESLRLDPEFALAHAGLAEALVRLDEERTETGLLAEAERHARRAFEISPDLGPVRVALARVARAGGRPGKAVEELWEVIPALPQPDEAYRELSAAYEQMGDLSQAEHCLRLAVSSGEENWFNWNALGALLLRLGRHDEAREAFERASELVPERITWPAANLAVLEVLEANWEAAIAAFERIEQPTRDPRLAANMGTAYFYLGRLDDAEALYRRAVRLDPGNPSQHRNLGDLLARQGRPGAARECYLDALELAERRLERTPGNRELRLSAAVYAAKADRCSRALSGAREVSADLEVVGLDAKTLAQVYAVCGAVDEAFAALDVAVESGVSPELIAEEDEFRALRGDSRFRRLLETGATPVTPR